MKSAIELKIGDRIELNVSLKEDVELRSFGGGRLFSQLMGVTEEGRSLRNNRGLKSGNRRGRWLKGK
jgi:hypothetical protein